jgi:hypothetical protein
MPIIKQAKSPTGTNLEYHEIHKAETTENFSSVLVYVRGYASEPSSNHPLIVAWMWQFTVPIESVVSLLPQNIELLLVNDPQNPLFGGEILKAETPLETLKRKKWMEIKNYRNQTEFGTFTWNNHVFDGDQLSQQRIGQAVQQATLSKSLDIPYTQEWTLHDNTTVTLSADDMVAVALAMGEHINAAHDKSRALRDQLDLATTPEEVALINWQQLSEPVLLSETQNLDMSVPLTQTEQLYQPTPIV